MFRRFRRAAPSAPTEDPPVPVIGRRGANPVVIEARGYLAQGSYDVAVTMAFHRVLGDIERAYGVTFPAGWTVGTIIDRGLREHGIEVGHPLRELYRAYAPIRYGPPDPERGRVDLIAVLESVYGISALWRLYAEPMGLSPVPDSATGTPTDPDRYPR